MTLPQTTANGSLPRDGNVASVLWSVATAGVVLNVLSLQLFGTRAATSAALGGAMAVANLWLIAKTVRGFLGGASRSWGPLGMIKLAALFVVLALLLKRGWAEALPLAFGYAALPLGIVLAQLKTPPSAV